MQKQDGCRAPVPELLALPSQDATRLLEVYVKRSLSLNDGAVANRKPQVKLRRSGTVVENHSRICRQESNASTRPAAAKVVAEVSRPAPSKSSGPVMPEVSAKLGLMSKKSEKKRKKPSFLKSILSLFSRRASEKSEEEEAKPVKTGAAAATQQSSFTASCLPFRGGFQDPPCPGKLQRKVSWRKMSFRARACEEAKFTPVKRPTTLGLFDGGHKPEVVSVEPNSTYYEKMSDELAKLVRRVKDEGYSVPEQSVKARKNVAAQEKEVIERITELLKQEGDAIDGVLKENSTISSFFQCLSYGSFQQLADRYVEAETPEPLPPDAGCKELVHFAVTLDFTAKMAGLSNQAVGRIMGFGQQYLQERFMRMTFAHSGVPGRTGMQAAVSSGYESMESQEQVGNFVSLD
ncbi:apoptosis facilitator Bcl-2-like protein 14 [Scleropages formosus]|uniref:apoptosis facilitator Bcl-2-like protein 14 n=1 Tax=Scleropages formosus TaxID=113540 RepID=UPI00087890F8|nr:apoptosis facilitator Bcl-2-like protein 14 [Scleropages formosus]